MQLLSKKYSLRVGFLELNFYSYVKEKQQVFTSTMNQAKEINNAVDSCIIAVVKISG